jgi:lysine 2,3-aminomutase
LDWKWQTKNRITTKEKLEEILTLTDSEKQVFDLHKKNLPLAITPYYASLISNDVNDPIRKCVVPRIDETVIAPEESEDPLGEDHQSPVSCIVHRYPDRVLFLSTKRCQVNCRYCTRSRIVGEHQCFKSDTTEWNKAFEYIQSHKEIRDVLVSGGDPLTLSDNKLEYILSNLRKIEHVEMIRIGTKIPAVLPQRVTPELCNILKKYHPLFMSLHFTHPVELTTETSKACTMLADAGIPLGSQTVLLKGINDNAETLGKLFKGLLKIRVRPYYTYIADLIVGSGHFRTNVETGINIFKELQGKISGYAIPKLIVDAPKGMGKIPVQYNYIKEINGKSLTMENYEGKIMEYRNG